MSLARSLALAAVVCALSAPRPAEAGFNVHERFPNDLTLFIDFDDGVEEFAGAGMRYKIDAYIWGLDVTAQYDHAVYEEDGDRQFFNGGSLGGQVMVSPLAFVGILIEDKILPSHPRDFRRLMEWVNLWIPAGVRVGLGSDLNEPRARLAAWFGLELVLRYAKADWPYWPHIAVSYRRQASLPEDRGATSHILFSVGFTRFIQL
jgi:hypothetical protein